MSGEEINHTLHLRNMTGKSLLFEVDCSIGFKKNFAYRIAYCCKISRRVVKEELSFFLSLHFPPKYTGLKTANKLVIRLETNESKLLNTEKRKGLGKLKGVFRKKYP